MSMATATPPTTASEFLTTLFGSVAEYEAGTRVAIVEAVDGKNITTRFALDQLSSVDSWLARRRERHPVHFNVGLQNLPLASWVRGTKSEVYALTCLFADFDLFKPGAEKKYPTRDVAMKTLAEMPLRPSLLIDSGFGLYPLWVFNDPLIIGNDSRAAVAVEDELTKAWQKLILRKLQAIDPTCTMDATGDVVRKLRLPGSIHHKAGKTVSVIDDTGLTYSVDEIRDYIDDSLIDRSTPINGHTVVLPEGRQRIEIEATDKFKTMLANNPRFRDTWCRKRPDLKDQSASGYCMSLVGDAVRSGWPNTDIDDLVYRWREKYGELGRYEERKVIKDIETNRAEQAERDRRAEGLNGANHQHNGAASKENKPDEEREPIRFNRITSRELATSVYEIEYLIERFLVARQPCIFAGPKKALKTTLLVAMAVALARGVHFLGRFKIEQARRVLVMSGESGISVLQETAKRICAWHECDLQALDNLLWSTDLPQVARLDHLDALADMLREDEVEVIVIDPAYLCIPSDDSANLFAMGAMLGNLSRVCQEQGATLVLAHHTRKGNIADPFEPPELEHIAFAGFQEFCRQWILVGRREKYEHGTGSHRLWLSTGGSAGHSGLWGCDIEEGTNTAAEGRTFDCTLMSAESVINNAKEQAEANKQSAQRDKDAGNRNRLLRIMFKHPEGGTRNNLRDWLGINGGNASRIIDQLLDSGQLVPCEVARQNRRQPYAGVTLSAAERERLAKLAVHEQAERSEDIDDPNERGGF